MTKAATVFEKLAKKKNKNEFNWKRFAAGVTGGAVGGFATAPLSTIATKAKSQPGAAVKTLNAEARAMKSSSKAGNILNHIKRYYRGTLPKTLSMGIGSGIAWGVARNIEEMLGTN